MTKPKQPQFIYLDPKASFWKQISDINSERSEDLKVYGLPNLDPKKFNIENLEDHPVIFVAKENKSWIKRKLKQLFYFILTKDLVWQWGKAAEFITQVE